MEHLRNIQRADQIAPSNKLDGRSDEYNLTIEMETGVGKAYTYIKTMYELLCGILPLTRVITFITWSIAWIIWKHTTSVWYKNGFVVSHIDGREDSVEVINGIKIYAGDVMGVVDEDQLRRIQIEVVNYRKYDAVNQPINGKYAVMFEGEYEDILSNMQLSPGADVYIKYLRSIPASNEILYNCRRW